MMLTLLFTLGEEIYGLEISAIQEIVEEAPLYYVPWAEGALLGAINFHSQVLAVIDLAALLGFPGEKRDPRRVVLTSQFKSLVLTVGSIHRIVNLDLSELQSTPSSTGSKAIRGVASLDETTINLLDMNEVINRLSNQSA